MSRSKTRDVLLVILFVMISSQVAMLGPFSDRADAGMTWLVEAVDNQAGSRTSIAVDSAGNPWIFYGSNHFGPFGLLLAHWTGSSWTYQSIVPTGSGGCLSLALDSLDRPHAVYDASASPVNDMHYAYWTGSTWIYEEIDSVGDLGRTCSLAIDSLDRPHVSYENYTWTTMNPRRDLKYAWRDTSGWHNETVDWQGWVGAGNTIAVDSLNRPHIAYDDVDNRTLKYAWWDGAVWNIDIPDLSGDVVIDSPTSVKIDSSDLPHIAYLALDFPPPGQLRYASWGGVSWTIEQAALIDSISAGDSVSLRLDSTNNPSIAYTNGTGFLSFTSKQGGSWVVENIDAGGGSVMGAGASLALDFSGGPHISYWGELARLKFAHRGMDSFPPSSAVDLVNPYWSSSSRTITATATDGESRVSNITLWFRFSFDNFSWGSWNAYQETAMPPWFWTFTFPDGQGYYQFYSVAADTGGNREPPPPAADAIAAFEQTKPSSVLQPVQTYWFSSTPLTLTAASSDAHSGVERVDLYYSHSGNNASWGVWTLFQSDFSPPWSWSFDFPRSSGWYRLYSAATDRAGNAEDPPATFDLQLGLDDVPPMSSVDAIPAGWHRSPIDVTANAEDWFSGVASVDLWFRSSPDKISWSSWTFFMLDTSPPWSWLFDFPGGDGFHEFHSIATDCVNNSEGAKDWAEANATYDDASPTAFINGPSSYWRNASTVVTATISDPTSGVENATLWYCFSLDNSSWGSWQSFMIKTAPPWSWLFDFPDGPGHYRFQATAFDVAGNEDQLESAREAEIGLDLDAPSAALAIGFPNVSSPQAIWITSSTTLTLTAYDGDGSGVTFLKQRTWQGGWSPWVDYSGPFTMKGTDGLGYLEFQAFDAAGNAGLVENRTIMLDDTSPATILSIGNPKHLVGESFVKSSTPLTLSAMDDGVGFNFTFYRLWNGSWTGWREYTTSFSLAGTDGTWFIEFLSFDYLGNAEAPINETVILDDTPPVTTISSAAAFTFIATDSGCGVNVTMYRIDGGDWTVYSGSFTPTEGEHTVYYYSIDYLGNIERERSLVVKSPPEVNVNYKPIVAFIFTITLLAAGVWSSRRRPWKGGKHGTHFLKAFLITSLPFVIAEVTTGVVSLLSGQLSIPPLVGAGMAFDLAILLAGIAAVILRMVKTKPREATNTDAS